MIEVLYVLIVTALATAVLGVFLVLRGLSMTTDAISHTILLGIVVAFFITNDLRSPLLIFGATVVGLFTIYLIRLIMNTRLVKQDAAIGIVFTALFAVAVILVSRYADNVHLDIDVVLMGQVLYAPLNRIELFGFSMPNALFQLSIILIINIIFISLFYKELKVSTFDPVYSHIIGFSTTLIYYLLMGLVSVTAVTAFDAVGAILVINFFVAPAVTAYLLVKRLSHMIILSCIFAVINSSLGYMFGMMLDVSMSGATSFVALIIFLIVFLVNPKGYFSTVLKRRRQKKTFTRAMILMLMNEDRHQALTREEIQSHFGLDDSAFYKNIEYLLLNDYIEKEDKKYKLTDRGEEYTHYTRIKYELPAQ
ncbi:metal ABC transporter permease [Corticicoccus populi]|uniref:Metal ABC transporter permease n=1 Tax=Corticicoccus populi TaxID=1812821 RepID=A0ABW5WXK5_9STAP